MGQAGTAAVSIQEGESDEFPDALSAGPRAGDEIMPILLVSSPSELGEDARAFIRSHRDVLEIVEVIGGRSAVADEVLADALAEARAP